jgi:hypothetical protein
MAQAAHVFPNITQVMGINSGPVNFSTDTLKVGLVASSSPTFNWVASTQAYTTVSQFLTNAGAGGGGALTEVVGGGYARVSLTGVTYTETGLVSTLTCANPTWTNVTFSSTYAFFYDFTAGGSSDVNGLMIAYWDFGGTQTVAGASFSLTINASGLVTWTSS